MSTRNKSKEGLIVTLINAPWQSNVFLAGFSYVVMHWLIPFLNHWLGGISTRFELLAVALFILLAVISYVVNKNAPAPSFSCFANDEEREAHQVIHAKTDWGLFTVRTQPKPAKPEWSLGLLKKIEWKRFEMLSAEYFRILGKRVETLPHGADGGIDARIYAEGSDTLEYAIQCKAWSGMVGVKEIRELFGVMAHESAGKGIFMTTSTFSKDAKQFAAEHSDKLFLIDGSRFISMIDKLSEEKQAALLDFAIAGDYTTPSCASCGIKMVRRTSKRGDFWGCKNFPRCKTTLRISGATA
jgi:restriction system protein